MSVRKDEVQLEITFITDESKALARTINSTKELQQGVDSLRGKISTYEKELKKTSITEERRVELLGKIKAAELGVEDGLKKIAAAGKNVEKLDLSKVAPSQLTARARQLAQAMALIPQSNPQFKVLETELGQINAQLGTLKTRAKGVADVGPKGGGLLGAILGVAGGFGLVEVLSRVKQLFTDSLKFFNIAQKGEAQLQAVLKSTGGAAGRNLEQLQAQSALLQELTLFDDDQTQAAQGLLLTFTNVREEIFDRTIPAVQDMATALATASGEEVNLEKATIQVGKALNDPIKGITALSKVGVSFTEQQKEQIRVLTQSGEIVKAQTIILNELQKEFGGSAAAAAKADIGATQLANKFENLLEKVGGLIATGLNPLIAAGDGLIDFFDELIDPVGAATKAFDEQADKVNNLERNINPLLSRYDELKSKSNLTKGEQDELKKIIGQVAEAIPSAVTAFGNYGEALDINSAAARRFIEVEKARLKFVNEDAITTTQRQIREMETLLQRTLAFRKSGGTANVSGSGLSGTFKPFTEKELRDFDQQMADIKLSIEGANAELARLKGETTNIAPTPPPDGEGEGGGGDPKSAADKVKAAQDAKLTALQAAFDRENLIIEGQLLQQVTTEQAAAERRLSNEADFYQKKLELLRQFGQAESNESLKLQNQLTQVRIQQENAEYLRREQATVDSVAQLAIVAVTSENQADQAKLRAQEIAQGNAEASQADFLARKKQNEENYKASVEAIEQAKIEAISLFFQISTDLLGRDEASRKRYAAAIKAFKIAEVLTSGIMEVQRIFAKYALVPGGQALALTESIPAGIRTAAAVAKIALQKFAGGGFTGPGIAATDSSGHRPAGIVHDGEYVVPKWMVNSPQHQPTISMLERARRIGYADGGLVNTTPTAAPVALPQSDQAALKLAMVTAEEIKALRLDMKNWQTRLKADVSYFDIERAGTTLNDLRDESNL